MLQTRNLAELTLSDDADTRKIRCYLEKNAYTLSRNFKRLSQLPSGMILRGPEAGARSAGSISRLRQEAGLY